MTLQKRISQSLSAVDPGRSRLKLASSIACGMLLSTIAAWSIVTFLHANPALLVVGIFLAMQMGMTPQDPTPKARCITTALMFIPLAIAATLSTLLLGMRPLQIAVLVVVAGAATLVRRFGPRATALGFSGFFGFFFVLMLQVKPPELGDFLLVSGSAVASLTLMRALLMAQRPRAQVLLLLRELRSASAAAISVARLPQNKQPKLLRNRLARIATVARAITNWQQEFDTDKHLACDEAQLSSLVLDARIYVEQSCAELVKFTEQRSAALERPAPMSKPNALVKLAHSISLPIGGKKSQHDADQAVANSGRDLMIILDNHAKHELVSSAAARASATYATLGPKSLHRVLLGRLTKASLTHNTIRNIEVLPVKTRVAKPKHHTILGAHSQLKMSNHTAAAVSAPQLVSAAPAPNSLPAPSTLPAPSGLGATESSAASTANAANAANAANGQATRTASRTHPLNWQSWQLTTRLAIQIMVAVSIATVVGELISASRWYWAVLTAFVVFIGASTRGSILTRAYYRVAGTAAGLTLGIVLAVLAGDHKPVLVAICIVAVFCMIYFGPIRYLYSAFFLSVMLVSMYGLLGSLTPQLLELRVGETIIGAIIGVLCAYFIFSSSSRPALMSKFDAYFAALNQVLSTGRIALTTKSQDVQVRNAAQSLNSALLDLDKFSSTMSAALIGQKHGRREPLIHWFYLSASSAAQFAQSAAAVSTHRPFQGFSGNSGTSLNDSLDHLQATMSLSRKSLEQKVDAPDTDENMIIDTITHLPFESQSPQVAAISALSRLNWVMEEVTLETLRN